MQFCAMMTMRFARKPFICKVRSIKDQFKALFAFPSKHLVLNSVQKVCVSTAQMYDVEHSDLKTHLDLQFYSVFSSFFSPIRVVDHFNFI